MTEATRQALSILRDPGQFQWYVIPVFLVVVYIYAVEIEKRNWNIVLGALAFWGMDWFNEIWNSLILHFTGHSAAWTTPGGTAYLILIGLNIEISLMFLVFGIVSVKLLPEDKNLKILGLPNRWFFVVFNSILAVAVEIILNAAGALVWEYWWWNIPNVILIFLVGYVPFMIMAYVVHDMKKMRNKFITLGVIYGVDIAAILVFGAGLGWI